MKDFVVYMQNNHDDSPLYVFDNFSHQGTWPLLVSADSVTVTMSELSSVGFVSFYINKKAHKIFIVRQHSRAMKSAILIEHFCLSFRLSHADIEFSSLSRNIHFYTRALCDIRPALTESMAASLGASLVQSRLDYANSIMYGLSASNMHKLQYAQNSLTRVVLPSLRHLSASERLNYLQ